MFFFFKEILFLHIFLKKIKTSKVKLTKKKLIKCSHVKKKKDNKLINKNEVFISCYFLNDFFY
jgi:hypothetical protein